LCWLPINRAVAQIEADDAVVRGQRLGGQGVEDIGGEPLVVTTAQGRVGHGSTQKLFDIHPRPAGDEADQDAFEAHPVRDAGTVTTERVAADRRRW
jgi:hypothetical protein